MFPDSCLVVVLANCWHAPVLPIIDNAVWFGYFTITTMSVTSPLSHFRLFSGDFPVRPTSTCSRVPCQQFLPLRNVFRLRRRCEPSSSLLLQYTHYITFASTPLLIVAVIFPISAFFRSSLPRQASLTCGLQCGRSLQAVFHGRQKS